MRTIQSEFKRQGITKLKNTTPSVKQPKNKERLSKWELEELMGIRRDTYKRVGSAIRRR
ncbi:hypothetical protein MHH37_06325 [Solibacillus sp. FSL K6-1781]|uniref:hypothetical protein n=1 Tax=Solibacillus sp. FSL K6-1781 TaxID=2921474 RepID=UPI00315A4FA1